MSEEVLRQLAVDSQERFFGKYRGFVVDNEDPEGRARIRLRVPSLLEDAVTGWAEPCLPFGGAAEHGMYLVPEVGAQVWVEFEEGSVHRPIWTGTLWQKDVSPPSEASAHAPHVRVWKTPSGHLLSMNDAQDEETLVLRHRLGGELHIDPKGVVRLTDADGGTVTLDPESGMVTVEDANGNRLQMASSGVSVSDAAGNEIVTEGSGIRVSSSATVTIEGGMVNLGGMGGEPLIRGSSFLSLFATHVHMCTAPGSPSSPPVPQGEMTTLSTTCMVK